MASKQQQQQRSFLFSFFYRQIAFESPSSNDLSFSNM
jgi:hypothetical protein